MQSESYMDRALRAYFKSGGTDQPSADGSTLEEWKGLRYIVLRNCNGVLAVYRILNDGRLKRLKRWSIQLEEERFQELEEQGLASRLSHFDYEIMCLLEEGRPKVEGGFLPTEKMVGE